MDRNKRQTQLHDTDTRCSVSIHGNVHGTRSLKSHSNTKRNHRNFGHRYYKYLLPVIAALVASPVNAETVGGVSATASPIANSSGSVTNQAIQVLQGPYITNTYGNGIQCQGATMNITPYVTGTASAFDQVLVEINNLVTLQEAKKDTKFREYDTADSIRKTLMIDF